MVGFRGSGLGFRVWHRGVQNTKPETLSLNPVMPRDGCRSASACPQGKFQFAGCAGSYSKGPKKPNNHVLGLPIMVLQVSIQKRIVLLGTLTLRANPSTLLLP